MSFRRTAKRPAKNLCVRPNDRHCLRGNDVVTWLPILFVGDAVEVFLYFPQSITAITFKTSKIPVRNGTYLIVSAELSTKVH